MNEDTKPGEIWNVAIVLLYLYFQRENEQNNVYIGMFIKVKEKNKTNIY